jgi:non-heme chloroperoxidase
MTASLLSCKNHAKSPSSDGASPRGHGHSTQVADGHDLDYYADDLKAVTDHLNLSDAIHVGHSTSSGEVVRCLARHGDKSAAKAAIISAVPPLMVKPRPIR